MDYRLKPYEEYKETGLPWLAKIPKHWEVKKIKHLFKERTEKGYPSEPLLAATQTKGVVPKNMYKNRTVVAQKDLHLLKLVRKEDFVISLRSFQGGIEYAYYQGIISPAYTIMVSNKEIRKRFFKHLAKSKTFLELLKLCVTGIREGQNIDYSMLKDSEMPLPPKKEQDQVARYLDSKLSKINKFIKVKKKQIELLKEYKQAIINQAVTKGLEPNVEMKPSGIGWLGDIPEGWEVRKFKYCFNTMTGISITKAELTKDGIDCIGYGQIHSKYGFEVDLRCNKLDKAPVTFLPKSSSSIAKEYDFIFCDTSEDLEGCGNNTYVKSLDNKKLIAGSHTIIARPEYAFESRFLAYQFQTKLWRDQIRRSVNGVKVYSITQRILKDSYLLLPHIEMQKLIVFELDKKVSVINKAIDKIKKEIDLITEYRTTLISDVVTGKVDVRHIEIEDETFDLEEGMEDFNIKEGVDEGIEMEVE